MTASTIGQLEDLTLTSPLLSMHNEHRMSS
jgi:hypothetical protein